MCCFFHCVWHLYSIQMRRCSVMINQPCTSSTYIQSVSLKITSTPIFAQHSHTLIFTSLCTWCSHFFITFLSRCGPMLHALSLYGHLPDQPSPTTAAVWGGWGGWLWGGGGGMVVKWEKPSWTRQLLRPFHLWDMTASRLPISHPRLHDW